jgi:hypothetical protein
MVSSRSYSKRANAIRPYNNIINIIAPMVGAHRVRPKCPLDICPKLRCTQIIPILLPSTQKPEEPCSQLFLEFLAIISSEIYRK